MKEGRRAEQRVQDTEDVKVGSVTKVETELSIGRTIQWHLRASRELGNSRHPFLAYLARRLLRHFRHEPLPLKARLSQFLQFAPRITQKILDSCLPRDFFLMEDKEQGFPSTT